MSPERPREIVNIDTFHNYIDIVIASVKKNPPKIEPLDKLQPKNNIDKVTELIQIVNKKDSKSDLRERVILTGIPWDSIPESVQRIMELQYDISTDEQKKVDIELTSRFIRFTLQSNRSHDSIDWNQDAYVPYGLMFLTESDDREFSRLFDPNYLTGKKGDFVINKTSLAEQIRYDTIQRKFIKGEDQTKEEKEWLEQNTRKRMAFKNIQVVPSSIIHLQDITNVVEKFKDTATLFTDRLPQST